MVDVLNVLPQALPRSICQGENGKHVVVTLQSLCRLLLGVDHAGDVHGCFRMRSTMSCQAGRFTRVETYVGAGKVVNRGLGQHGVVLEERLPQRGSVLGNDDQLGLAAAEALEGGFLRELLASRFAKARSCAI